MPVPIAEQDPTDQQHRNDSDQRVSSSRQSRHRTATQRSTATQSPASSASSLFDDYTARVQQMHNEVNKVFGKERPGSIQQRHQQRPNYNEAAYVTDMRCASSVDALCSDTQRKRELYRDTELLRMDFCDEVSQRQCSATHTMIDRLLLVQSAQRLTTYMSAGHLCVAGDSGRIYHCALSRRLSARS